MRFVFGDVSSIAGRPWAILELKGEVEAEVYLRRILRAVKKIFEKHVMELHVPIKVRGLDQFELFEGTFVYVRSDYFIGLARLKRVWGIEGLVTKKGTGFLRDTLWVEDQYIEELRKKEQEMTEARGQKVVVGAGVRVLDGQYRDFHGKVVVREERTVKVEIDLGFRKILLDTFVRNLREEGGEGEQGCWVPGLEDLAETAAIQTEEV